MKIGLGTVQFGLNYGINNLNGRPNSDSIRTILDLAEENGIDVLDTAADYGDSEKTIGEIAKPGRFKVVTKVSKTSEPAVSLRLSLQLLRTKNVYAFLFHDFQQFASQPGLWAQMIASKNQGLVQKIGFSLYYPAELEKLLAEKISFDIVQVPYNIFDQRFGSYFEHLKKMNVEIHVRSIFLQGLVFLDLKKLNPFFEPLRKKLERLQGIANANNKSLEGICLSFANSDPHIDRIVIGVDSAENLRQNLKALKEGDVLTQSDREFFREENEQFILPYNWKLE